MNTTQSITLPDGRSYTATVTEQKTAKLQERLRIGAEQAATVIDRLHRDVPQDAIVRSEALSFSTVAGGINVDFGDETRGITDHALSQMAEKVGVPAKWIREMARANGGDEFWKNDLAAAILRKHFANRPDGERSLVRSVHGNVHGFLSDRYRRIDSRPLVDTIAKVAKEVGAVPWSGTLTDTRSSIQMVIPRVIMLNGDPVIYGGTWSHSDFGNGIHGFSEFILRMTCLNGATALNVLRQVHLGGRLSDNFEFSERTVRLDTEANVAALEDTARGLLSAGYADKLTERLTALSSKPYTTAQLRAVTKGMAKATAKLITDAFESEDVINLPPGDTQWRASNAVSWVAQHTEDSEQRLDLEKLAGKLLLPPNTPDEEPSSPSLS